MTAIQTKDEREKSIQLPELLFECVPVGLLLTNLDGKWLQANAALLKMIGLERSAHKIESFECDLFDDFQLKKIKKEGRLGPIETKLVLKDHRSVVIRLHSFVIEWKGESYIWSLLEEIQVDQTKSDKVQDVDGLFLKAIIENIPMAVVVKSIEENLKISLWNSSAEKLFQIPKEQALNRVDKEFWDLEMAFRSLGGDLSALEKSLSSQEQIKLRENDKPIYLNTKKIPIRSSGSQQPTHLLCIYEDITNAKKAELEQERLLSQLHQLTENSPAMLCQFVMNGDGSYQMSYLVPSAFKKFDINPADYQLNHNIFLDLIHPEDLDALNISILYSAANLEDFEWIGRIVSKIGRTIWVEIKSTPKIQKDGSILWTGFVADITDQKQIEIEREKFKKQLEREQVKNLQNSKLSSLGDLCAGIAHEVNNPLAVISAAISVLDRFRNDPEKFSAKINSAQRAIERIIKVVNGLKKFARTSEGSGFSPTSLSAVIRESLLLTEAKSKKNSTVLILDLKSDANIYCDEVEIEQVITNLVNNAIEAVQDLEDRWVKLVLFEEKGELVLQIKDSGLGISPVLEEKLFQPFFTTKAFGQGTGMNLSIAKGILDKHGASIYLNKDDMHTCFELRFRTVD